MTPLGSDDVTIPKELEQEEDKSWSDATPGCNKLLTREEIIEKEEPSPEPLKVGKAELEPEKEKPEKEKSEPKDSTNPDESDDEYHDSFGQQEFDIKLDDSL